jgi:nicotinamidase-related amidase
MTLAGTALLVIDVQMAFANYDATGVDRSCRGEAERNIASLLAAFRTTDCPVIHVHHHSNEPDSAFRPERPGSAVQPFAAAKKGERVYIKRVNSSFIGTSLEADLRSDGVDHLVICGATANHCCETTARMAGNLGFEVFFVADAVWAYGVNGPDGARHTAEEVHSMTLANLDGEFARVLSTQDVIDLL